MSKTAVSKLIVGTLPSWRYSSSWGYYPSAGLGVLFVVVLVLFVI